MPESGPDGYYDRERPPFPPYDGPDRGGFRGMSTFLFGISDAVYKLVVSLLP